MGELMRTLLTNQMAQRQRTLARDQHSCGGLEGYCRIPIPGGLKALNEASMDQLVQHLPGRPMVGEVGLRMGLDGNLRLA